MVRSTWPKALEQLSPAFIVVAYIPYRANSLSPRSYPCHPPPPGESLADQSCPSLSSHRPHSDFARGSFSLRIKVEVQGKKVSIRLFHANEIALSRARTKLSRFELKCGTARIHRPRDKKTLSGSSRSWKRESLANHRVGMCSLFLISRMK